MQPYTRSIDETNRILTVAEELQDKCDRYTNRIYIMRMIEVTAVLFGIVGFLIFLFHSEGSSGMLLTLITPIFVMLIFYALIIEFSFVRKYSKQRYRDARALNEVVGILREIGDIMADQEKWPELDRVEYRIRLSRFGIGGAKFYR